MMKASVVIRALTALILGINFNKSVCIAGTTSKYMRRLEASTDLPLDSSYFNVPSGYNAPEQVHLTQGDYEGRAVIVSWITPLEGPSIVAYGLKEGEYDHIVKGSFTSYSYYNYSSGHIHHATLNKLEYDTTYYYQLGNGASARHFSFATPPKVGSDSPYTFGVIGDLGQTYDSLSTLQHYLKRSGQTMLYVGDFSYADHYPYNDNFRWDTWGRLLESSTAYQPWIWTAGNHELEFSPVIVCNPLLHNLSLLLDYQKLLVDRDNRMPISEQHKGEKTPFKSFLHRYHTPYRAYDSTSPLWYSIKRASAHIIVLSSYSAYGKYTPQWVWLQAELAKVDRTLTPWLIVLMHSPLYNSNSYHYMEGETFRVQFESWFVMAKVDIIFAGHVHAYERTHRISNVAYSIVNKDCTPVFDESAPVYITIGDGGNIEGSAGNFTEPQPEYSAFREASFGHAILDIKNRTHAYYYWHRNQDGEPIIGDSSWLLNRFTPNTLVAVLLQISRHHFL